MCYGPHPHTYLQIDPESVFTSCAGSRLKCFGHGEGATAMTENESGWLLVISVLLKYTRGR